MKNTIRVRQNGASKRAASQVQKPAAKPDLDPAFQLPDDAPHACCLAIVNRDEQALIGKVPLSETEFDVLWETGVKKLRELPAKDTANMTPADYLAQCLRQSLRLPDICFEFESAKAQSHALHWVLFEALNSPNSADSRYGDEMHFGMSQLIIQTQNRLDKVYATLEKIRAGALGGEGKAVAS